MWGIDNLNVETGAERRGARNYKLLIRRWTRGGEDRRELSEAKSGVDSGHIGVVGEVKVEGLVERESDGIVVESNIVLCGN